MLGKGGIGSWEIHAPGLWGSWLWDLGQGPFSCWTGFFLCKMRMCAQVASEFLQKHAASHLPGQEGAWQGPEPWMVWLRVPALSFTKCLSPSLSLFSCVQNGNHPSTGHSGLVWELVEVHGAPGAQGLAQRQHLERVICHVCSRRRRHHCQHAFQF